MSDRLDLPRIGKGERDITRILLPRPSNDPSYEFVLSSMKVRKHCPGTEGEEYEKVGITCLYRVVSDLVEKLGLKVRLRGKRPDAWSEGVETIKMICESTMALPLVSSKAAKVPILSYRPVIEFTVAKEGLTAKTSVEESSKSIEGFNSDVLYDFMCLLYANGDAKDLRLFSQYCGAGEFRIAPQIKSSRFPIIVGGQNESHNLKIHSYYRGVEVPLAGTRRFLDDITTIAQSVGIKHLVRLTHDMGKLDEVSGRAERAKHIKDYVSHLDDMLPHNLLAV